jgi:hypothetical protein
MERNHFEEFMTVIHQTIRNFGYVYKIEDIDTSVDGTSDIVILRVWKPTNKQERNKT